MITNIIMCTIVIFLGALVLFVDKKGCDASFFDIETTNCMRGFWSLIVLIVHVPSLYHNTIQDVLGSFAYIGVSFFFMTSSYGLTVAVQKKSKK